MARASRSETVKLMAWPRLREAVALEGNVVLGMRNVADGWLRVRASRCRPHASSTADGELFVYPGEQHFFADASLDAYDPDASALLMQRVRAFLASI